MNYTGQQGGFQPLGNDVISQLGGNLGVNPFFGRELTALDGVGGSLSALDNKFLTEWATNNLSNLNGGADTVSSSTGKVGSGGLGGGIGAVGALQLGLSGIQTLAGIWGAYEQRKLAKKQFKFSKDFANANLANQISSYNTALSDRSRSRGFTEGNKAGADAYYEKNKLPKTKVG